MIKRVWHFFRGPSVDVSEPVELLPHDTPPTELEPDLFARQFLAWCHSNNFRGEADFEQVVYLAQEFAEYVNVVPLSERQLTLALMRAGIRKSVRDIPPGHKAHYRLKCRHVKRPRFTVYDLDSVDNVVPGPDNVVDATDRFPSTRPRRAKASQPATPDASDSTDKMERQRWPKKKTR